MKPVRYKRMFGGTRMIMKKHSLAGTCGIPTDAQRIYIPVDANGADDPDHGPSDPVTIHWPDGRSCAGTRCARLPQTRYIGFGAIYRRCSALRPVL